MPARLSDRHALPGDWIAVASGDLTLLLPGSERARAASFWSLVDSGAGAERVLDALIADGVSNLGPFVLVELTDTGVRVLVRGEVSVYAEGRGGTTRVGAGHRVWADERVDDLDRVVVDLGAGTSSEEGEFLLRPGLCRVGALTWGTPSVPEPVLAPEPLPAPVPEPVPVPAAPAAERTDSGLPPIVRPVVKQAEPPVVAPVEAPIAPPEEPDEPEEEPLTQPLAATPPAPTWQEDVTTHMESDGSHDTDDDIIPFPPSTPPPAVGRLVFSHGLTADVAGRPFVVGRAPSVPRGYEGPRPELVTVPSPLQEVSSTHAEFRAGTGIDHGRVVVTDLGSTNGTVVDQPGEMPEELRPGVPLAVAPGSVVDLGDGVVIRVTST